MAKFSKLKKRNSLGVPPSFDEASQNLTSPEVAPALAHIEGGQARIDGRSLRKTNRTVQFATKVTHQFDDKFRAIAARDNLIFGDLLEKMLEVYELTKR